jgi:hypothetical protein
MADDKMTETGAIALKPLDESGPEHEGGSSPIALSEALIGLKKRVDRLEATVRRPFYLDRSFWIGITTIPLIFASGWLVKFTTDRPFLLREIHRLLGTEPALVAALDERSDPLKEAIQSLKDDRLPFLTAIFRVGLMQERAQQLNCSPDTAETSKIKVRCEIPQDASVNVADAPFTVGTATKVDVGIVVNVTENVYRDDGYRASGNDRTNELESKQLIRVAINGRELSLSERSRWSPSLDYQGARLAFAKYKFSCFSFDSPEVPDFPINTLTVSLSNSADRRYSVTVATLISKSQDSCDNKK